MSEKPGTGTDQTGGGAEGVPAAMSNDDAAAMAAAKDRKKRRAHKRHSGHEELNITAMLDLMTIILVFLMKQWQNEAITLSPEVRPPASTITHHLAGPGGASSKVCPSEAPSLTSGQA